MCVGGVVLPTRGSLQDRYLEGPVEFQFTYCTASPESLMVIILPFFVWHLQFTKHFHQQSVEHN